MNAYKVHLIIFFILFNYLNAQYIFKGTVEDVNGNAIKGVNVSLNINEFGAKTDDSGVFFFSGLNDDLYDLKVSHIGYNDFLKRVNIKNENSIKITLNERIINFDKIVVTGTRNERHIKDTPILTHVISGNEILNSSFNDVKGIMQTILPNLQSVASNHVGDRVKLQGIDNKYMLFLIDGDRVSGEYAGNIDFSMLNLENIERIEIIENSMSTIYGSGAVGGVVNIITKLNKERYWSNASYLEDEFLTKNQYFNIGASNGKIYYDGYYMKKNSNGFDFDNELPKTIKESNNEVLEHRFLFRNEKYHAELSFKDYKSTINQYKNEFNINLGQYEIQYDAPLKRYNDRTNKVKLKYGLSNNSYLKALFLNEEYAKYNYYPYYYNQGDGLSIDGLIENGEEFKSALLNHNNFQINYVNVFDNYELLIGYDYSIDEYSSFNIYEEDGDLLSSSIFNGINQTRNYKQYAWYIHNQFQYIEDGEISFSIRGVKGPNYESNHVYSLSQMAQFSSGFTTRLTYSTGFRLPSLKELYYEYPEHLIPLYGNPDLLPTTNQTYSFSIDKRTFNNDFSVNFYINNLNNYISTEYTSNGSLVYRNYDAVTIDGINLHYKRSFLNGNSVRFVYNYTDIDSESMEVLELVSKHAINLSLRSKVLENLYINVDTKYVSKKFNFDQEANYMFEQGVTKLEAYSITNILFSVTAKDYVHLKFGIKNIFDYKDPLRFDGDSILSSYDPGKRYYFQINFNYKGAII